MKKFKINDKVLVSDPFGELIKGFITSITLNGYRVKITSDCSYKGYELYRLESGVYEDNIRG